MGCLGAYRPLNEINKQCSTGVHGSVDLVLVSDVLLGTVHCLYGHIVDLTRYIGRRQ